MTGPLLGRLRPVPPRDVWPHEARDFTPWLLENVDVLSDLLGMDLALDVAEHPVGGFSLDLLGQDQTTGRVVIVENQLEVSDHTHLGQILTYAAGTKPTTIVWITTGFRPEHRAALDWLNERTDEGTRFFGVEIEVVQIDDSPKRAPAFKLVAQPNDWEKQVRTVTAPAASSERGRVYWDFWEVFRTRIQREHPSWSRARSSTRDSWFTMATGTNGTRYCVAFTQKGLANQLIFEDPDPAVNERRFGVLIDRKDAFEAAYGMPVTWEGPVTGRKKTQIVVYHPTFTDVADAERWPEYLDWLIDQQSRMRSALATVGGVPAASTT